MLKIILKVVGYILLAIGIVGGVSNINMLSNGNSVFWVISFILFCGIGVFALSVSKRINNKTELKKDKIERKKPKGHHRISRFYILFKNYSKKAYTFFKDKISKTENFYLKAILTIIALLLLIISVEIHDLSSHESYIYDLLWRRL